MIRCINKLLLQFTSAVPQSIQRHCWEFSQWPSGQDSTLSLLWPGVQSLAGEQDPEAIEYSQKKKKALWYGNNSSPLCKETAFKSSAPWARGQSYWPGRPGFRTCSSGLKLPPPGQTSAFCLQYLFGEQGFFSTGAWLPWNCHPYC